MSRLCSSGVTLLVLALAAFMGACSSSSPPISVSLSPSSPQAVDQGQTVAITATVANDKSYKGVAWTLTGPGSLSSSTGPSVTYTSPTTNLTSAQQVTVTATSGADPTKSASLQITVNPYLQIPFQTLANGSVGASYSQIIALTGGTPPFQWSLYNGPIITGYAVGGSVPDGLKLNATSGTISGTPTGGGTWYFEATATDATGVTADNGFLSIQVNSNAAPGNPVPFLNQPLVPTAVSPGASGFTLSVSGTGFASGAAVNFSGAPLATTFVDSEHLAAMVPAANVASAGTAAVTVVNPGPGGGPSNVVYFQVAAPEATVNFANAANSPLQIAEPFGIVAADFNEDGKPDLAIAANVRVYVFLGNGDGTFAPTATSPVSVPSPPYDDFPSPYVGPIAVGDFNHSGHQGLAVGEFQNEAAVILLGNGNGSFAPSSASFANAFGMPITAIEAADFNADGNLDLAITNQFSGESPVNLGYGNGAFNAVGVLYSGGLSAGAAVGDVNGDGRLDAIVANSGTTTLGGSGVTVSLGKGDGTFTLASGSPIPLGKNLSAIVTADFNGDGKLDLAVTDAGGNAVLILLGNGDGTFGTPTTIPVGNQPYAIVAADFDNDGKLDLAVANYADGTITLLLGNGDGTFTQAGSPHAVGHGPYQIVAADFNGDGKLDLATANLSDGTVSILLQQ
jgi:VCBS repeat protein/putative Ig domain-containing protein/FG-GAP repeat protein